MTETSAANSAANKDLKSKKKTTSLNSKILRSVASGNSRKTMAWATGLAKGDQASQLYQIIAESAQQAESSTERAPNSLSAWVDAIFDAFQQYEVEFNRIVGKGSNLAVQTDPPMFSSDMRGTGKDPGSFTGKVHTKEWALMIRGNLSFVEGYIVPCNQVIAFTGNPSRYSRYFFVEVKLEAEGLRWRCAGVEIKFREIRLLAKQLFTGFIRVVRGEADERTPFVYLSADELSAGILPEGAPLNADSAAPPSNVFEDKPRDNAEMIFGSAPSASSGASNHPQVVESADSRSTQLPSQSPQSPSQSPQSPSQSPQSPSQSPQSPSQLPHSPSQLPHSSSQSPSQSLQSAQSPPRQPHSHSQVQPQSLQSPYQQVGASQQGASPEQQARQGSPFEQSCLVLIKALDFEIQSLSNLSTKAFQLDDIEIANRAIKRATKMSKLKGEIVNSIHKWREEFKTDD